MVFRGWPTEAVEFYEGLQADNTKTYWMRHKDVYDASVYAPMADLLAELADEFGAGHIFRPYRDVRFRADKSPYKTAIYATLEGGGYVGFKADGLTAGTGYFRMAPDQLARFRHAVDDDAQGADLTGIIGRLTAKHLEIGAAETLKSAPRGYPKDHQRVELLRYKGLIAYRHWPTAPWLGTVAAKRRVVEFLRTATPLQAWLNGRVGPSLTATTERDG